MKKLILILAAAFLMTGCCEECAGDGYKTRDGRRFRVVKVCSKGDMDGSSCVEYKAANLSHTSTGLHIKTLDGKRLEFNWDGWSILIDKGK